MNPVLSPLVATDLSVPAHHAAERAAMLARQSGGKLALVYVMEKNVLSELKRLFDQTGEAVQQRLRQQATQALADMALKFSEPTPLQVSCHLVEGAILSTITEQADTLGSNLVVVGSRGAGFMRHWLLGATAERLLRSTRHPILMVRQAPRQPYHTLLVPVDFSARSAQAIELAQRVSPQAKMLLLLLHACELPFEGKMRFAGVEEDTLRQHRETIHQKALAHLHEIAADAGLLPGQWRPLVAHTDPTDYILEQEEVQSADLIVMGKHGTGMTEELLLGSVTKHVLSQSR